MRVSFIVPAYNEAATIGEVLDRVGDLDLEKQIVVVDDGSTDGTARLARDVGRGRDGVVARPPGEPGQGRRDPRGDPSRSTATSRSSRTPTWSTTRPTCPR